jgi:hypothetical protein
MEAQIEQRTIIKILSIERRTTDKIHKQLLLLDRDATCTPAIIYKWICEFRTGWTSIFDETRSGQPLIHHIDGDIFVSLNNNLFHTVRMLAHALQISVNTVYDHLRNVLCSKPFDCPYVPHNLRCYLKMKRAKISRQLLEKLDIQ